MRRAAKVTISLPLELLEAVARRQEERGESRSETIAHLLDAALRREQEQADIERYVRGYMEHPASEDEVALSDRLALEAAALDPWP
jgi:metal-responsive CopG/Arc/MetJ family transcriptional regulator